MRRREIADRAPGSLCRARLSRSDASDAAAEDDWGPGVEVMRDEDLDVHRDGFHSQDFMPGDDVPALSTELTWTGLAHWWRK